MERIRYALRSSFSLKMIIIRILLLLILLGGPIICLCFALKGLWYLCTKRVNPGLKILVVSVVVPTIIFFVIINLIGIYTKANRAAANWAVLKGRVLNEDGTPAEGVHVKISPDYIYAQTNEPYNHYKKREAITDSEGLYELKQVQTLSTQMTVSYFVNSNVVDYSSTSFFYGLIYADYSSFVEWDKPKLRFPVISENRIKQVNRYLFFNRIGGRNFKFREDVSLPESKDDVIFLPDIVVSDTRQKDADLLLTMEKMRTWEPKAVDIRKAENEIESCYFEASPEVKKYILWTAKNFGAKKMWLNEDAFADMPDEVRKAKIKRIQSILEHSRYDRSLTKTLAEASAFKDDALVPGLLNIAGYQKPDSDYDCRPKWMAVAALSRQESDLAVPLLVSLVDHGNENTRIWARAALVRKIRQDFKQDKSAWAEWWKSQGNRPIDDELLKPWVLPANLKQQLIKE